MNVENNHNSKDLRNEEELRALQESGAPIARARFDSIPDASEFRGRLKAQLLEKRELKRTSMWQKTREVLAHLVPTQKTFAVAFVVFLLVAVVSTTLINRQGISPGQTNIATLFIDRAYAKDNFEIIPTSGDGLAVDSTTEFVIKSKTALSKDALLPHLHMSPAVEFDLKQVSDHEFRLTPKSTLAEKQVYSVKIDAAYTDEQNLTVERDFSFAFQVKNVFKMISSIPANQASGVPLTTGIEMTFSNENFSDYEKNFSILPKVDGKFEVHGRTLVFVPKELKASTLYTVTLKKDIEVKGTAPMLADIVFKFETGHALTDASQSYWYMNTTKAEFSPNGPMLFSLGGVENSQEFVVRAFAFKSFDAYKKNFLKQSEIPAWAFETQRGFMVPESDITLAREFTIKPQDYKNEYSKFLVLPENLPLGDYWIEVENKSNSQKQHIFLEVTNLLTYLDVTTDKTLVWVNDLSTKNPLENVEVLLVTGEKLAATNGQGVAEFESDKLLELATEINSVQMINPQTNKVLEIRSHTEASLFSVSNDPYLTLAAKPVSDNYIFNFSTDRSMYLPNDRIQFWGFIQKRDGSDIPKTFTVGIPNPNNYFYGRSLGDMGYLQSVDVMPDAEGYFRGEIKLSNLTATGYSLVLSEGKNQIVNRYLEVIQYTKPSYTLSVKADKNAIFSGETISFKAKANFFEGTPLPNYALTYTSNDFSSDYPQVGSLKTDKNGEATWSFASIVNAQKCNALTESSCYSYPSQNRYHNIMVNNVNVEEAPINQYVPYSVFSSKVDGLMFIDSENKTIAKVSSSWSNIDLAPLNNDDYSDDDKMFASPAANKAVEGVVFETHYEKHESGEYYDFINKVTEKTYTYDPVVVITEHISGQTDSKGHFETKITTVPGRSYEVRLLMRDDQGHESILTASAYSELYGPNTMGDWYSLRDIAVHPGEPIYGYKVGDTVKMQVYKNDGVLENGSGKILFLQYQDGLKKYTVQSDPLYAFQFGEENIPNVYVGAVYFDGTRYNQMAEGIYRTNVMFDSRDRALKVTLSTDKNSYKPGEDITVSFDVKDAKGDGYKTKLNVSVIDEAYLAMLNGGVTSHMYAAGDPLTALYAPLSAGTLFEAKSHKSADLGNFGGAEGGGCFLSGTPILLADGTYKNIENITVGESIGTLKSETDNTPVTGKVLKVQNHIVSEYRIINGTLRVTPEHRILINGEWKTAGDIRFGDMLRGEKGEPVKVFSVETKHELVKVYNFAVEQYHTYIAGGIYVHNDKGGAAARSQFPDVALYQWVETDRSGHATLTFKLPDSVTGWRVTAEALGTDLYAGIGDKTVNVSLPVFGLFSVPSNLLTGDKPMLTAVAYGNKLRKDSEVQMKVSGDLFSKPVSKSAFAFDPQRIFVDTLVGRSGKVRLDVSTSEGKDAIEKSFSAQNSRLVESEQTLLPLQNGPLNLGAAKISVAPVEIKFVDAGLGSLYSRVGNLAWDGGTRLDQKVGALLAHSWFKDFFTEQELGTVPNISPYILNGFKLLPYSTEDLSLSVKVAAVLKNTDSFDKERLSAYFIGKLYDVNATSEELSQALWGASALGESVLPSIHTLAENKDILPQNKIYLALAAGELGDSEYARSLYEDILDHVKETETTAKVVFDNEGKNEILENSALLSVLAARLQEPLADKLDKFVVDEPKEVLMNLESLLFVKEKMALLPKGEGSLTLSVAGQTVAVHIADGVSQSMTVASVNFDSLSVADLRGPVAAVVIYDKPAEKENLSTVVKLTREYFVQGNKVDALREGDLVEVRLTPVFGKDAPAGQYLVEDSLPSGLKLTSMMDVITPWTYSSCFGLWPFEVDAGRVKFMVDRDFQAQVKQGRDQGYINYGCMDKPYLSYFARVSTLGEFRKEGALIQSMESNDVKNFSLDIGNIKISE